MTTRMATPATVSLNASKFLNHTGGAQEIDIFDILVSGALSLAVGLVVALENVIVLYLYMSRSESVVRNRCGFTLSLSCADGLMGICWVLQTSTNLAGKQAASTALLTPGLTFLVASIWSLFALVLDRYMSIKVPLRHENIVPSKMIRWICAGIWMFAIIAGTTEVILRNNFPFYIALIIPSVVFLPPAVGIILIYLAIHIIALRARRRLRHRSFRGPAESNTLATRVKDVRKMVLLFGIVFFFNLFGVVLNIIILFINSASQEGSRLLMRVGGMTAILARVALACNPWIHSLRRKVVCRCCYKKERDVCDKLTELSR